MPNAYATLCEGVEAGKLFVHPADIVEPGATARVERQSGITAKSGRVLYLALAGIDWREHGNIVRYSRESCTVSSPPGTAKPLFSPPAPAGLPGLVPSYS
jgi:hypothetical protein